MNYNVSTCGKMLIAFSLFTLQLSIAKCQTLKPDIITTTGDYYANSVGSLSWTMGEPIIETYNSSNNILTQGFQQSSYSVNAVDNLADPVVKISVYPNPFLSTFIIRNGEDKQLYAEVIDVAGKVICKKSLATGETQIDLSTLSDALYLLKVYDLNSQTMQTFKIEKAQ